MMEEEEDSIPDRCPVCRKKSQSLLLHILKKDSCKDKIEPELYEKWKNEAKKRSKKKYQEKFVKSGKHKEAQKKYIEKCKKSFKESHLKIRRQVQAKYVNRMKVQTIETEDRKEDFNNLCIDMLHSLRQGRTPSERDLNRFHLIESDFGDDDRDHYYAWLEDIDGGLLLLVICFQKVCLLPGRIWLDAYFKVECKTKDRGKWLDQHDTFYRLIGQLASYRHTFEMEHLIPCGYGIGRFKFKKKPEPDTWQRKPETFTKEDEEELKRLISEIFDDTEALSKDLPMQNLLKLTEDIENLDIAMSYTKRIEK